MFGRRSRALYAVFSNPAAGVEPERFRAYYEDVHRPDTLALGHFDRSHRYEAASECRARYLTLWEAEYPDLESALARVRAGALELRARGRVWPVQEVVFHQFVFSADASPVESRPVAALTTVQNDWRAPARSQPLADWLARALPEPRSLPAHYTSQFAYAAPHPADPRSGRFLWLGESQSGVASLATLWQGRALPGLAPLGRRISIFPPAPGDAVDDDAEPTPDPAARTAAWVVHWTPRG